MLGDMEMIKGKTISITGGAGFIGLTIAERLIDDNKIVIFDNLTRNSLISKKIKDHANPTLIKGDVFDSD